MLAFAHINLLEMLRRFTPEEAVRAVTDSIYVQKAALHKISGVGAFVGKNKCSCGKEMCWKCLQGEEQPPAAPAQWRDKSSSSPQQTTQPAKARALVRLLRSNSYSR